MPDSPAALHGRLSYYGVKIPQRQPGRMVAGALLAEQEFAGSGWHANELTMLATGEVFSTFRWVLAIICTVYTLIVTGQTLKGWLAYFMSSRHNQILGHYTMALLLRVRLKLFAWELAQIGGLLAMLFFLVYAHRWLE